MKKFVNIVVLAVLLGVAGVGMSGDGSDKPDTPKPKVKAKEKESGGALTATELNTLLENMGYEVKEAKNDKKEVIGGSIKYEGKGYTYTVSLMLSPNQSWVWITIWLAQPPNPKIPADKLKLLMSINDEIGPCCFTYNPSNNYFRLKTPIYNRGIKAPIIRAMLKQMDDTMANPKYAAAWNPAKWEDEKPKEKPKAKDEK